MGDNDDNFKLFSSKNKLLKFCCENCDYFTDKKSNIDAHNLTAKHMKVTNGYIKGQKQAKNQPKTSLDENNIFVCSCGKKYKHRQGLWRHKTNCLSNNKINKNEDPIKEDKELIMLLIQENSELKNMMMEVIKNGTHNTTNNTNSHNKSFNLNFFLNETCKNAMNIMDFVDTIHLQLSDLEKVGELGYVEGISNIIVKNLKKLDVTERPVHCTDSKR